MKKQTLGSVFGEIRREKRLTMAEIANKCGVHESTVSNIERNRSIRWETVHLVLSIGVNIQPGSQTYQSCHLLWLKGRQEKAEAQPEKFASKAMTKHAVEATRKFRMLIRELDPKATSKVLAAAARVARSL